MTERTDDDVRAFIDVDDVVALWDDLVVPSPCASCVVGVAATAARRDVGVLSALQQRVARLVAALPDAEQFAPAGGAALVLAGRAGDDRAHRSLPALTAAIAIL
jgi:hypothetical protein